MLISQNHFDSEEEKTKYCFESEKTFQDNLNSTIEKLLKDSTKFIGLTGPTCAGKTTTANMIIKKAEESGKRILVISIDDFFYDREYLLKQSKYDETLVKDFDSVKTLDIETIKEVVDKMNKKEPFKMPQYDFVKGMRTSYKKIESQRYDIFLFEGIQILYPEIKSLFSNYGLKIVFIDAEEGIRFDETEFSAIELRFLRRLVRDYYFRNATANLTFSLWGGVRDNEEKSIYPYSSLCDYKINSAMPFEIGVLKPYLTKILGFVRKDSPNYEQAHKILYKLQFSCTINQRHLIEDSLYREFIPFDN